MTADPYTVLGVPHAADPATIRAAYRRLVKLHHPDHNGGSPESARRFEEVQEAYAALARGGRRPATPGGQTPPQGATRPRAESPPRSATPPPREAPRDPAVDDRLADLERQVRDARVARERAERAARKAAAAVRREAAASDGTRRPTDEELGYVDTDDTLGQILSDARSELSERLARGRDHPVARRVSDLIAGLEDLADGLERHDRRRKP